MLKIFPLSHSEHRCEDQSLRENVYSGEIKTVGTATLIPPTLFTDIIHQQSLREEDSSVWESQSNTATSRVLNNSRLTKELKYIDKMEKNCYLNVVIHSTHMKFLDLTATQSSPFWCN